MNDELEGKLVDRPQKTTIFNAHTSNTLEINSNWQQWYSKRIQFQEIVWNVSKVFNFCPYQYTNSMLDWYVLVSTGHYWLVPPKTYIFVWPCVAYQYKLEPKCTTHKIKYKVQTKSSDTDIKYIFVLETCYILKRAYNT